MTRRLFVLLLWVLQVGPVGPVSVGACSREPDAPTRTPIRVAAASSLSSAFEVLGRDFERTTGHPVVFSFGSTGLLAKQLREGAPFDVFASADVATVDALVSASVCDGATKTNYARGRLALWSRVDKGPPPTTLVDLTDERFVHIAIANPEHAPYGQAAQQALQSVGLWDRLKPRLVYGENIRQALQFAQTGNAEVALVALSLVVDDHQNPFTLVDESLHRPLDQALVVCGRGTNEGGLAFARFVASEAGRAVLRRHGYSFPLPADAK